jgi:XRE family transcriptional regulator of biofilm formation
MAHFDPRLLADRLRQLRELRGLSVSEVASRAGLAKSYVAKIEKGVVDNPGLATVASIAHVLEAPLPELFAAPSGPHRPVPRWAAFAGPLEVEQLLATAPESLRSFLEELEREEGSRVPADVVRTLATVQLRNRRPESVADWRFAYSALCRSVR